MELTLNKIRTFRFYKEPDNRWYVDLPEWEGDKFDLEMVAGADTMLNIISEDQNNVWLTLSEEFFEGADKLEFVRLESKWDNGAYYKLDTYKGLEINLEMWLCDVTKFVFGDFPKEIFLSTTN